MKDETVYTVRETALRLKKSSSWVYRRIKAGGIEAARLGNSWRISAAEIRRLLKPANVEEAQEWLRQQLDERERKHDQALKSYLALKYTAKNMAQQLPQPQQPGAEPPCR